MQTAIQILVDADSCPVKEEIYKVGIRHQVRMEIVCNSYMKVREHSLVKLTVVSADFDAADDYIVEKANADSIVITADILLADRALKNEAQVIAPNGTRFTKESIGTAVATRALMEDLRAGGEQHGGPPAFSAKDRSRFLSTLHEDIVRLKAKSV